MWVGGASIHVLSLSKPLASPNTPMAASLSSIFTIHPLRIKLNRHSFSRSRFITSNAQQFFIISPPKRHLKTPFSLKFSNNFSQNSIFNDDKKNNIPSFHHFLAQAQSTASDTTTTTQTDDIPSSEVLPRGRIYQETYGCQMNVNDMEIVLSVMKTAGYNEIVSEPEKAEIIFINTCAIRDNAEQRVWQRLNYFWFLKRHWKSNVATGRAHSLSPPKVVVLGCMAERLKDKILDSDKMVDVVCGPDAYRDLPRLLEEVDNGQKGINTLLSLEETYADISPVRLNSNSKLTMFVNPRANYVHSCSSLAFNSKLKKLDSQIRGFCGVPNSDGDSEVEDDEFARVNSSADAKEVERVCNVIEELFALDRNMEAVLDGSRVNLTHDLVTDVLERFKHARRPAFRFFSWAGQQPGFDHDSRTYNTMMNILGKTKQFETMISLLDEMGEKKLLTLETFQICIRTFAAAQQRRKAVGIFELMKKYNFKVGVDSINVLLDNLSRAKLGKEAQILFEKLKGRFTPNIQTYTILLNGWCKVGNLLEAGKVWNEMIDTGINPDIVAHNIMLEGLLKVHKRSDAVKLFEIMKSKGPNPNERSYTIIIRDLCKQKRMKEAVECYENMLNYGCTPDVAVYTCLITGFGNQKQMDKVYGLLKEMKENGCPPDGRMYNALIKLMTNRQMPDDAVRIYKKMIQNGIEPTIHTYNMMMKSFFRTENYEMGVAVWEEMGEKGVCPDDNSYTVFINGLIMQGKSVEACKYLEEMIEKGMKPPQIDYNKFNADLFRAGKGNILEDLGKKMRLEGKLQVSGVFFRYAEMMKKTNSGKKGFNFVKN